MWACRWPGFWELKGFWLVGILRVIYEFVKNLILNSQMENRLKNS